jgi:hypothetical protein
VFFAIAAQHGLDQGAEAVSRPSPVARLTMRVIREEAFADASDAPEIPEALPPN